MRCSVPRTGIWDLNARAGKSNTFRICRECTNFFQKRQKSFIGRSSWKEYWRVGPKQPNYVSVRTFSDNVQSRSGDEIPRGAFDGDLPPPTRRLRGIRKQLEEWKSENQDDDYLLKIISHRSGEGPAALDAGHGRENKKKNEEDDSEEILTSMMERSYVELEQDLSKEIHSPGDLVEFPGAPSELAVLVQDFQNTSQFYTERGRWVHLPYRKARFVVPSFVKPEFVEAILPYLPAKEVPSELQDQITALDLGVPRELGAPVINELLKLRQEADRIFRDHSSVLNAAFDVLSTESQPKMMDLSEMASLLLERSEGMTEPSPSELYATHCALSTAERGFRVSRNTRTRTNRYAILSKTQLRNADQFVDWGRKTRNEITVNAPTKPSHFSLLPPNIRDISPLQDFIFKARKLIRRSRRQLEIAVSATSKGEPEGSVQAPFHTVEHETFTDQDRVIISVLEDCCARNYYSPDDPVNVVAAWILRATGSYDSLELGRETLFLFLKEIGVYAPWEAPVSFQPSLQIPGYSEPSQITAAQKALTNVEFSKAETDDSLGVARTHTFEHPVYCIDSKETTAIDDGISLERLPDREDVFWVHVHVANPSAFISPDHPMISHAQSMYSTMYLPERTLHMLPESIFRDQFSLMPGAPAMTISAKVTDEGEMLESKISATTLQDVHYLTPSMVNQQLGFESFGGSQNFVLGVGAPPSGESGRDLAQTVSEVQLADLRQLHLLTDKLRYQRSQRGGMALSIPQPGVSVYKGASLEPCDLPSYQKSHLYHGHPIIEFSSYKFEPETDSLSPSAATGLVTELMLLAGNVAARWSRERSLPMCYRGNYIYESKKDSILEARRTIASSADSRGFLPFEVAMSAPYMQHSTFMVTQPLPHLQLGMDEYMQATSPLRRFGDLLNHWQIGAVLAHEARTGRDILPGEVDSVIPFSREHMEKLVPQLWEREVQLRTYSRKMNQSWICQFFERAVMRKEIQMPDTFEFYVLNTSDFQRKPIVQGWITMFSVAASMKMPSWLSVESIQMGDRFEVSIDRVSAYTQHIWLNAVKVISKAE